MGTLSHAFLLVTSDPSVCISLYSVLHTLFKVVDPGWSACVSNTQINTAVLYRPEFSHTLLVFSCELESDGKNPSPLKNRGLSSFLAFLARTLQSAADWLTVSCPANSLKYLKTFPICSDDPVLERGRWCKQINRLTMSTTSTFDPHTVKHWEKNLVKPPFTHSNVNFSNSPGCCEDGRRLENLPVSFHPLSAIAGIGPRPSARLLILSALVMNLVITANEESAESNSL